MLHNTELYIIHTRRFDRPSGQQYLLVVKEKCNITLGDGNDRNRYQIRDFVRAFSGNYGELSTMLIRVHNSTFDFA